MAIALHDRKPSLGPLGEARYGNDRWKSKWELAAWPMRQCKPT